MFAIPLKVLSIFTPEFHSDTMEDIVVHFHTKNMPITNVCWFTYYKINLSLLNPQLLVIFNVPFPIRKSNLVLLCTQSDPTYQDFAADLSQCTVCFLH